MGYFEILSEIEADAAPKSTALALALNLDNANDLIRRQRAVIDKLSETLDIANGNMEECETRLKPFIELAIKIMKQPIYLPN